ncbi:MULTISPECIES: MmgE/PrpD family protein [Shinella]|uniref:MmgE/PrpD family protein n=1 Tax=Shinella sedimenti TaxID=2919913 RepID=A0ABT0CPF9_9HYPH|nr:MULTISPECIES: MmgE/PrpD family protein [Shinella]MCJ8150249.1 MmgE/PrpD family protein [Shinella sedimenti]
MSEFLRGAQLSKFVSENSFDALPNEVVEAARQALVDYLGVAIAAVNDAAASSPRKLAAQWNMPGKAQVILGGSTQPMMAALANGTMAHAMDLDDTHSQGCGHPSGPCWSTALAMAQQYDSTEAQAITAFVTGYEVMARLGGGGTFGVGRTLQVRGFHPTSMVGRMGAVAAASSILALDARQIDNAFGCVATTASGLLGSFGTHGKPFHAGKAAMDGILSAELAKEGFIGGHQLYEKQNGWLSAFLRDDTFVIPELDFIERWELLETGYKRYASCRATHTPAETAFAARPLIDGRPIERIVVYLDRTALVTAGKTNPKTGLEGRFSIPFCIAMALVGRNLGPFDFKDEITKDPEILNLLQKIETIVEPDQPEDETRLEVYLENGEKIETVSEIPFGDPRRPFTWDDHHSKFTELVSPVLGVAKTEAFFDLLKRFGEREGDLNKLRDFIAR